MCAAKNNRDQGGKKNTSRDWTAEKEDRERLAITAFCRVHPENPTLIRQNNPPAPDFTLDVDGREVFVELGRYREQGPHNEANDSDEEFKRYFADQWIHDDEVNEFAASLHYKNAGKCFRIPSVRKDRTEASNVIAELKRLVARVVPRDATKHVTIRFVPESETERWRRWRKHHTEDLHVPDSDYPALAKFYEYIWFMHHSGLKTGYPRTSVGTRHFAVDYDEIQALVERKHKKLHRYRASAAGRPVWLLLYDEGHPSTGRLPRIELDRVAQFVRNLLNGFDERFDGVWWGHELLLGDPKLLSVYS